MDITIPCEECICLAICRHRSRILCDILNSLASKVPNGDTDVKELWNLIHESLPYADRIRKSNGRTL